MADARLESTRLRRVLLGFFFLLTLPTAAIIWQAFDQLKFEAFYQYRNQAEALTARIDARLATELRVADSRRFADFAFLNVTDDRSANILQRSPLSRFPVADGVPGVLGYFQVGPDGEFSTPLLPQDLSAPDRYGIPAPELAARTLLADTVQKILADNRLVPTPLENGLQSGVTEIQVDDRQNVGAGVSVVTSEQRAARRDEERDGRLADAVSALESSAAEQPAVRSEDEFSDYSQQIFDDLAPLRQQRAAASPTDTPAEVTIDADTTGLDETTTQELRNKLRFDEELEKKSEMLRREDIGSREINVPTPKAAARSRRVEQAALPEAAPPSTSEIVLESETGTASPRVLTFESEIDPYDFRLLDSGHLVLFRKVWRDGQRFIQGLLIDRETFLQRAIDAEYQITSLAAMSDLTVGYYGDIISTSGRSPERYSAGTGELRGTLLFSRNLSAPLDGIELVYSVGRLPLGPGARVLAWTTLAFAIVFALGFIALYRLGLGQIRLARQQQDFVSAVSHELKTPLTSIRMYGEMLKEGWVEEDKQQQYYAYIRDESERLTRLIANVLRLAKMSRNDPQLSFQLCTLGELADHLQSKVANQITSAGFELAIILDDDDRATTVNVDIDCATQIVINLIDNALKFSKDTENKTVELTCSRRSENEALLAVRDFGHGVPRDQMRKIFTLFYRSESELTRETVGTGIGLAIVHQLTLAMNGKIDVVNRDPGAEFRVTLPVAH